MSLLLPVLLSEACLLSEPAMPSVFDIEGNRAERVVCLNSSSRCLENSRTGASDIRASIAPDFSALGSLICCVTVGGAPANLLGCA